MDVQPALMSKADYARHRGVDAAMVTRWLKAGKIQADTTGKIDAAAADLALGKARERIDERQVGGGNSSDGAGLTRARTAGAVYEARLKQLRYEQALGKLVLKDGVIAAAQTLGEQVVRVVTSLSARRDGFMAAAKDPQTMREFLKEVEGDMRARLAEAFAAMARDASAKVDVEDEEIEDAA